MAYVCFVCTKFDIPNHDGLLAHNHGYGWKVSVSGAFIWKCRNKAILF